MKKILLIILLAITTIANAQEWTTWLQTDTTWHTGLAERDVSNPDSAEFWNIAYTNPDDTLERFVEQRYKNGSLRGEKWQNGFKTDSVSSHVNIYHPTTVASDTGQINHTYHTINGVYQDTLRSWRPDGTLKRLEVHGDGELINGSSFDQDGMETLFEPFFEHPVFPGGEAGLLRYLSKSIRYPRKLMRKEIEGMVMVKFHVAKDGNIEKCEIVDSPHYLFSEEVIRVVQRMPRWKPGTLEGERAKVEYNLPVNFTMRY